MLHIVTKTFSELTTDELYALLQLRSEVFVVEQNCVYQDIDYKDQKAVHILGFKNEKLIGYTRIFKSGDYFNEASIGRVVIAKNERSFKYGHLIIQHSIEAVYQYFKETIIKISAQQHLKNFYETHQFVQVGEWYLEDDIPHIPMIKSN